jgi:hypothetical protein
MTQNTTDIVVEWKLEGEALSHTAIVEAGAENEWLAHLPATMGDGRIVYRVTTSNGEFDIVQPWLTMGTTPPEFDGSLWGARAQGFAGAFMIIALMLNLQGMLQPTRRKDDLDQTAEVEAADISTAEEVMPEPAPAPAAPEPTEAESTVDEAETTYSERLVKYDEYPDLLWDPVEEEWVDDPEAGGGQ